MTILIVDDNENNLYQLQVLLGGNGYQVVTAVNGAEALAKARQNPPDLIISDILMPVMDGFALCREWKKDERLRQIPFVFYTATYTDERDREFALSLGAEQFIVKPEEPETFVRKIREVIQQIQRPSASPARVPIEALKQEEVGYLKQYNEALIRKLEAKMEQLEQANRELERDITEHKRTDEALRESEARFSTIFHASPVSIAINRLKDSKIIDVNDSWQKVTGFTRDEAIGHTSVELNCWVNPSDQNRLVSRLRERSTVKDFEAQVRHKSGRVSDMLFSSKIIDIAGEQYLFTQAQDITERKKAEAEKEKLRTQLVQAQKMEAIGHLAGGIAHDFNNVLAAIVGYASLMKTKMEKVDPLRPNVDQILSATERATTLVRSLLAFSRKQIMDEKPVRINNIVSSILKLLTNLLGEDISIETIYDARDPLVMADAGQIDQVLINLATNARDAMPNGGHLIITTDVTEIDDQYIKEYGYGTPGGYSLITVSDTGAGMDRSTQEKIFEPFFTTKEVGKGTGLGLSTAYGIVKQHSGFINCYSEPGKGTTFKIYLPLLKTVKKAEIEQALKKDELTPGGSETILVAEDDESVRKLIVYILEQFGYTVYEAADGEQAVKVFMEHETSIDLLLFDVIMPHKNGREAYRAIKKIKPGMKALFTSGYTADLMQKRGILEKGFELILKPVTMTALLQKVREVLDRK